ncbi:MAG: type II secretion system protein [Candidatus Omnitrophota bacterium]|nr:type II secretion system protein [Candidatus Omnitrophota bacterium]
MNETTDVKRAGRTAKAFTISELLLVFVIVLIIGGAMLPFIKCSREKMEKITCANNLRETGLALYIYARGHDGRFPPSLKTLYDEHYLADECLMSCPASGTAGTPGSPDYIYTAGLTIRDPSLEVLVRDKSKNHPDGGKNVLYLNGSVAWEKG